jgi:hypothetical protein
MLLIVSGMVISGCGKSKSGGESSVTDSVESVWFTDADQDGFGDKAVTKSAANQPDGYVSNSLDCDDSDETVNPMYGNCEGYEKQAGIIPDTGQVHEYLGMQDKVIFGQDSNFLIDPHWYTKRDENGNDLADDAPSWKMVYDHVTQLTWEIKNMPDDMPNADNIHDADNTYAWDDIQTEFLDKLNENNFGNHNDWRLPTARELSLIINCSEYDPIVTTQYFNPRFPYGSTSYYVWTATEGTSSSKNAYLFYSKDGTLTQVEKTEKYYVWAVRGTTPESELVDLGNGIIKDKTTGLMWQKVTAKGDSNNGFMWEEALKYCSTLEIDGFRDWRLPNRNELMTLIRFDKSNPAINTDMFPGINSSSGFWTSTVAVTNSTSSIDNLFNPIWYINFYENKISSINSLLGRYYVKAVRGGLNTTTRTWYRDADKDNYGDPGVSKTIDATLPAPTGYVSNSGDCDDTNQSINPAGDPGSVCE